MFKEEETQYCPMCEEWANKYAELKAYIKQDLVPHSQIYINTLNNIREIILNYQECYEGSPDSTINKITQKLEEIML